MFVSLTLDHKNDDIKMKNEETLNVSSTNVFPGSKVAGFYREKFAYYLAQKKLIEVNFGKSRLSYEMKSAID